MNHNTNCACHEHDVVDTTKVLQVDTTGDTVAVNIVGGNANITVGKVTYDTIDCTDGDDCNRKGCRYNHPPGHVTKITDCRKGDTCSHPKCSFKHSPDWNPFANIDCRVADACGNRDCRYRHKDDHDYRKNVACGYKDACKNGKCPFKHSATWDSRANIKCNFGPGCTKKTTTCKFKHE